MVGGGGERDLDLELAVDICSRDLEVENGEVGGGERDLDLVRAVSICSRDRAVE